MTSPRSLPLLRRTLLTSIVAAALLAIVPGSASALTVTAQTPTSCDTHAGVTDWSHDLALPKFSLPGATLTAVTVSREVAITSTYAVESRDGSARTITLTLNDAGVTMTVPGFAPTQATLPKGSRSYAFTAFDGTVDFAGTSGASGGFGTATDSAAGTTAALAAWTGLGTVTIPASSSASTTQTQTGNLRLNWDTESTARACVTYTYTYEVLVCIGDYVWYDSDRDGIQDAGETGVAGRPIVVRDAAGNVIGTATSDANGRWKVCGLEPSTACVVSVDLPDGWNLTTPVLGTDRALDSDGYPAGSDATINCLTPPSGEDLTFDVGIHQTPPTDAPSPRPPSLRMTKVAARDTISSGATVRFTVRVTNRGGLTARTVRVCDTPPAQLAFTSRPRGATMRNGQLCWNAARIAPGRTVTYVYVMRAANVAARSCVINRVTASAAVGGTASARDNVCVRATELGILQLAG